MSNVGEPTVSDYSPTVPDHDDRGWLFAAWRFVFITGNRLLIAAGMLGAVYGLLVGVDVFIGGVNQEQVAPLLYLFSALVGGNFTLITIILSISQLVISRQLGSPGELREQIEGTNAYREAIEETMNLEVAPVTPTEFLHMLHDSSAEIIDQAQEHLDTVDGERRDELIAHTERLDEQIDAVITSVSNPDVSVFGALAVTLSTNHGESIYQLRQLRAKHGDAYPEEVNEALDDLVVRLKQIDVARQYLKTVYVQQELAALSRHLLYVGVPAVVVSVFVLRTFAVGFDVFSPEMLFGVVPLAITVAIAPLAVLFAYVLRLASVAERTIAITPFTLAAPKEEATPADN
ncbi:hypothetical protein C2R22_03035 [Salinigranum rubrum]|uniref:Uncharacterized protein n=1 Tax=Salinigranum rubrum TaxID=755307 RepID=A0A2I8VFR5_9EURY|nr:hypothetical protein C2R22_03035 [Salinigranum rubrum]